jgi:sugar phosphate isomerase/epimerase
MHVGSMDQLGIEHLSVFGLPPVAFVHLAADLGCRYIATGLTPFPYNPHGYGPFSLRDDAALRREMTAEMRDRGVSISLGEGCTILSGNDISGCAADLDIMRGLGVDRISTVSLDPDLNRSFDQFGVLAGMAAAREMEVVLEPCPILTVSDLTIALAAIDHVGSPNFRLLIDTMHVVRSGSGAADLAAIDPALIGYVQICDAPLEPVVDNYPEESLFERMVPGEGELPLRDILAVLPPGLVIGLEVPMRTAAEAGIGPQDRLQRCVDGVHRLLSG